MDAKLFKNFHCFVATGATAQPLLDDYDLGEHEASDPTGSQWSAMGFLPIQSDTFTVDVQGAATLACVQVNERILPGAVMREKMLDRITGIEHREGRKVGKKEYAQLKDEVVYELLPQAFIRRKLIPILFVKDRVLVFTSSVKLCDDVTSLLVRACPTVAAMRLADLTNLAKNNITGTLTTLAREGCSNANSAVAAFYVANGMVLKGDGKKTIVVKDKDVQESDIQDLLKQAYEVVKLRLDYIDGSNNTATATFTLSEHLVFTGMLLHDINFGKAKDDAAQAEQFMTMAWVTVKVVYEIVSLVIEMMGGTVEDDDEL